MGTSHRRDDMRAIIERAERDREAMADAVATVEQFNARLAARRPPWFWPTIGAALATKHHWLVVACDACETVVEVDLRMKPRDPDASIRVALRGMQCPRCNGSGAPRIIALARFPAR